MLTFSEINKNSQRRKSVPKKVPTTTDLALALKHKRAKWFLEQTLIWKCKCKLELWLSFLDNFYGVWPIVVHTVGGAMLFQVETQGREWEARKAFPLLHTQQTAVLPNWQLNAKLATFYNTYALWEEIH